MSYRRRHRWRKRLHRNGEREFRPGCGCRNCVNNTWERYWAALRAALREHADEVRVALERAYGAAHHVRDVAADEAEAFTDVNDQLDV